MKSRIGGQIRFRSIGSALADRSAMAGAWAVALSIALIGIARAVPWSLAGRLAARVATLAFAGFACMGPTVCPASATSLPQAFLDGFINAQFFQTGNGLVTLGDDSLQGIPAQFVSGSDLSVASAGYTTTLAPFITTQAHALKNDSDPTHTALGDVHVNVFYYFSVNGPTGVIVPVNVAALAQVATSFSCNSATNVADGLVGFVLGTQDLATTLINHLEGTSFTSHDTVNLTSDTIYEVNMFAAIQAIARGPGRADGTAAIDPIFTIDPNFADAGQFNLGFSDGITNTTVADVGGTPLPAALPLFATGLGGLGLLGWRRRRKLN